MRELSGVTFSSVAQSCPTLFDPMDCSTPGLPVHHQSWSSLKLMSTESVMPQLEKNQEILPSTRDEALFRCSVSREIPHSLFSLERVLDTLDATQEVPLNTHLHSRRIPNVLPQLKKSLVFPSSCRAF